jgi:glutamate formiminotransferase/formiminotetrahydrofolate cyclodeaminase
MNLTDIKETPLHIAFEECCKSADKRGLRVTGSELVGLVPKSVLIDAGKYFLKKQRRSRGVSEEEIIRIAVKSLGLDELTPFDPDKKIIEYLLEDTSRSPLVRKTLSEFADETASESPAPGGGSISAYAGVLGVSLGTMVANLSAGKPGWDDKTDFFSYEAEKGQNIKNRLLELVDADTAAFNKIMDAVRMPKSTPEEVVIRQEAIKNATIGAIEVPLMVMRTCAEAIPMIREMAEKGNPNSVSDAGVGILCLRAAIYGAYLNVKINCSGFDYPDFVEKSLAESQDLLEKANHSEKEILEIVNKMT